jgi:hypothetical protein
MMSVPNPIFRLCPVHFCLGAMKPTKRGFVCFNCGLETDRQGQVVKNNAVGELGVPVLRSAEVA